MHVRWARFATRALLVVLLRTVIFAQDIPASLASHKEKAEQALRLNDRDGAEREFRQMLVLDSQNGEALTGLGVLLYGEGKAEESASALESALKINPLSSRAELFLGLSRADLHDCPVAAPILSKHFDTEPAGKLQRLTGMALLGCISGAADPMPALRTVARLKQLYPDDADVLYEAAELYTRLWTEDAGELMAKHPESYRVHQLAGEVYEAQNNYDQAIREYSLALDADPKLPHLHFRIGQLYLHKGAPDADEKATVEFRQELAVDPQSAVSNLAMAEIDRHEHKLDEAKPLYEEAVRLDATLVAARVGLAQILLAQHEDGSAVRELQETIQRFPGDAQAHYVLMLAYREQNKLPEAGAEMATFKRLQQLEADKFRNKMSSMMMGSSGNGEPTTQ